MSFNPNFFSDNFVRDFSEGAAVGLADLITKTVSGLGRDARDTMDILAREIDNGRTGDEVAAKVEDLVYGIADRGADPSQYSTDVVEAVILSIADEIYQSNNNIRQSEGDVIHQAMRRNNLLDNGRGQRSSGGSWGNQRQSNQQRSGWGGNGGQRNNGGSSWVSSYQSNNNRNNPPATSGRSSYTTQSPNTDNRRSGATWRSSQQQAEQGRRRPVEQPQEVAVEETPVVVESGKRNLNPAPIYTIGVEKAEIIDGKAVVKLMEGDEVKPENHTIERFFRELLPIDPDHNLAQSLRAMEAVRNASLNKLDEFIAKTKEGEDSAVTTKMYNLQNDASCLLGAEINVEATSITLDDLRGYVLEALGKEANYLQGQAVVVKVHQLIDLGQRNDVKPNLDTLLKAKSIRDLVEGLIALYTFADPYGWKAIHDMFTERVNHILLQHLSLTISSITADFPDLNAIMVEEAAKTPSIVAAINYSLTNIVMAGLASLSSDGDNYLQVNRTVVLMPCISSELEIAAPTTTDYGVVPASSVFTDSIKNIEGNDILLITTDGVKCGIYPTSDALNMYAHFKARVAY